MPSLTEHEIIQHYFTKQDILRQDVLLGIGDDAAIVRLSGQQTLAIAVDTLVEGVHFLPNVDVSDLGYKSLAVNLSDLAAMGAQPAWFTLSLTLPKNDSVWLEQFASGLWSLAKPYHIQLIGGDLTRGPLTITIQVHGLLPANKALCRSGAKVGDKIYVSGTLGDAKLGLQVLLAKKLLPEPLKQHVLKRLYRPSPRLALGQMLLNIATSAIDISDGFAADLNHILVSSGVGAKVITADLPLSHALQTLPVDEAKILALTGGDDYELCFTIPPEHQAAFENQLQLLESPVACRCVGEIVATPGIELVDFSVPLTQYGYQHF